MPAEDIPSAVPGPESIPVNTDRMTMNLLNQMSQITLSAAQWKAVAEEMIEVSQQQQRIIDDLKRQLTERPVHNGRVTSKRGAKNAAQASHKASGSTPGGDGSNAVDQRS